MSDELYGIPEAHNPFEMFEKLLTVSNKLMAALVDNVAILSSRVKAVEDKLDYRKQAQDERFIPPENSTNRGED